MSARVVKTMESAPLRTVGTSAATAGSIAKVIPLGSASRKQREGGKSHLVPVWKRMLDIGCIVLALPVVLPLMALIGLMIKLLSDGPAVFRQERIGHLGKSFVCLKFRTMAVSSDPGVHHRHLMQIIESSQPMTKMDSKGDDRLIPLGRLLRATGLDELPQLINVLRGEMSLVGPRPCLRFEYEWYQPWQRERFNLLPGLTGLWQVSGKNRTTFEEMVRLDIHYSRNLSLGYDLRILFKTLPVLVAQAWETRQKTKCDRLTLVREPRLETVQTS